MLTGWLVSFQEPLPPPQGLEVARTQYKEVKVIFTLKEKAEEFVNELKELSKKDGRRYNIDGPLEIRT